MPAPSKRDKQSQKRFERTRAVRTRLRNISKNFYRAIEAEDTETATRLRDEAQKAYGSAAGKNIVHGNKASRTVGRFDKALAKTGGE